MQSLLANVKFVAYRSSNLTRPRKIRLAKGKINSRDPHRWPENPCENATSSKSTKRLKKCHNRYDFSCSFYRNFTCTFTYEINVSHVNYFNSTSEMKISCVKSIFICEMHISNTTNSYVKFWASSFHICKRFLFHMWNKNFMCEMKIS